MAEKILSEYTIVADKVPAKIKVYSDGLNAAPIYDIKMPQIGKGTSELLDVFADELAEKIPINFDSIIDNQKLEDLKHHLFLEIRNYLEVKLEKIDFGDIDVLAGILLHRMQGLGFIDVIMSDNHLEEIAINGPKNYIAVFHQEYGWCRTTKIIESEEEIYNISSTIGRKTGHEINSLNPIMDAQMLTGDRVSSTLFPISTMGNTITIRRFSRNPWTPISLIKNKTMDVEILAILWTAIQYELNVLVAGATASGKTSALNALCSFIQPTQRVVSIEDTREINLPKQLKWNWVPLSSRPKNPEGKGEVSMLDLMIASLRMRPDRNVVGEIRKKEHAETLFEAMHTGHSVYATIHADTAEQVKRRLIEPPLSIPKTEIEALHLVLVQYRDRRKGARRTLELVEVLTGTREDLKLNYLYRYRARKDTFEQISKSERIFEELNLHTGMTSDEIYTDLDEKKLILKYLVKNDVVDVDDFGRVMNMYYSDKDKLIEKIKNKEKLI